MATWTSEYPNGTRATFSGPWGTLVRLENVPRFELPEDRVWFSGKWAYPEEGQTASLVGWEVCTSERIGEELVFHREEVQPVRRHSFNTRQRADGSVAYPGKYFLWYTELVGGWYLS